MCNQRGYNRSDLFERYGAHIPAIMKGAIPLGSQLHCAIKVYHGTPSEACPRLAAVQFQIGCFMRMVTRIGFPAGVRAPASCQCLHQNRDRNFAVFIRAKIPAFGKFLTVLRPDAEQARDSRSPDPRRAATGAPLRDFGCERPLQP